MPLPHWKDCQQGKDFKKIHLTAVDNKGCLRWNEKRSIQITNKSCSGSSCSFLPFWPTTLLSVAYNACTNSWWTVKHRIPALLKITGWTHTHAGMALWTCGGLYTTWVVSGDVYSITKKPRLSLKGPDHRAQDTRALLGGFYFFQSHHKYLIWHWSTKKDGFEKCVRMSFFVNMHWV